MNVYELMNWGAWVLAFLLFGWVLYDFIKTEKAYDESVILATIDRDET
ncbi:MAG: hypothetical protein M0021_11090 [Clostridia bacterium]|nr:hypothetical protein [Clostridia bacterium]